MTTALNAESSAPMAQPDDTAGVRLKLRGFCSACRQVLGMPDYERYLAHAAQLHSGVPLLTRGEYCARELERRYGRGGARCC